jgi:hypothetical protein
MAAVTRIRIIARPIENGSTTYTGFKKMHPQHEINQRLPPASGNDDGPSKMPAAQQRAEHQSAFVWAKMSHNSVNIMSNFPNAASAKDRWNRLIYYRFCLPLALIEVK